MTTAPGTAPAYQAVYRACMKEAAAQGRMLMQRLVVRASEGMQNAGNASGDDLERRIAVEAARTLIKHESTLCEAYPPALLAEFAHAIAGAPRKAAPLSYATLELIGADQM